MSIYVQKKHLTLTNKDGSVAEVPSMFVQSSVDEFNTKITEHNSNIEAHEDIRAALTIESETRADAVTTLNSGYASLLNSLNGAEKRVRILEKTVQNLEDASKGKIADDVTDDRLLHTKTLGDPEKCGLNTQVLPNGELLSIGGRTVVWNQLCDDQFDDRTKWNIGWCYGQTSGSFNDGIATLAVTNSSYRYIDIQSKSAKIGKNSNSHYYILYISVKTESDVVLYFGNNNKEIQASEYYTNVAIIGKNEQNVSYSYIIFNNNNGFGENKIYLKNVAIIDLTQMFGAGNEPESVDAFEALFDTSVYHPYNAGTLMSLPCKEVVTKGKNLVSEFRSNTRVGAWTSFVYAKFKLEKGKTYTFSLMPTKTTQIAFYRANLDPSLSTSYPSVTAGQRFSFTFTTTTDVDKTSAFANLFGESANVGFTFENPFYDIQIEESSNVTAYTPYRTPISHPIPAAIRALPGYGWSAGTAKNSIYWNDEGRLIERIEVDRIDTGTLTYFANGSLPDGTIQMATRSVTNRKLGSYNALCEKFTVAISGNIVAGQINLRTDTQIIGFFPAGVSDPSDFKSSMSGIYLYYELAEPVETDITELLPPNFDNILTNLETGGTVTFVADGVDPSGTTVLTDSEQSIPVPNSIAYQTKIAS